MKAVLFLALCAAVVVSAVPVSLQKARGVPPKKGTGTYVPGSGFKDVMDMLAQLQSSTPRKDGSADGLSILDQCPKVDLSTPISMLPTLEGPDSLFNFLCYWASNHAYEQGLLRPVFMNWYNDQRKQEMKTLDVVVKSWKEADILSKFSTLVSTFSLRQKNFLLSVLHRLVIAEYVQSSGPINGFLWGAGKSDPTELKHVLMHWAVKALTAANAAQPKPTALSYRGRTRRGSDTEMKATFKKDNIVWELGFGSSSADKEVALGYTLHTADAVEIIEVTPLGNGKSRAAELHTEAKEVLWPVRAQFKVTADPVCQTYTGPFKFTSFVTQNGPKCTQGKNCRATWKSVCTIKLQEIDTETAKCPGGSVVQECAPFKKLTVPGNLFWSKLGKCSYRGTPYTCPVPKGRGCYSCVLCKTNNKIEAKVFTAPGDYCAPTATAEGIYVGPTASTTTTPTTTTPPKPTTTNGGSGAR